MNNIPLPAQHNKCEGELLHIKEEANYVIGHLIDFFFLVKK